MARLQSPFTHFPHLVPARPAFETNNTVSVSNKEYCFRGSAVQLPELTITINVNERRHIPTESLIITEEITEGDLLRIAFNRIKLERLGREVTLMNNETIKTTYFAQDGVLNYDLFCVEKGDTLGFNSPSVVVDY